MVKSVLNFVTSTNIHITEWARERERSRERQRMIRCIGVLFIRINPIIIGIVLWQSVYLNMLWEPIRIYTLSLSLCVLLPRSLSFTHAYLVFVHWVVLNRHVHKHFGNKIVSNDCIAKWECKMHLIERKQWQTSFETMYMAVIIYIQILRWWWWWSSSTSSW